MSAAGTARPAAAGACLGSAKSRLLPPSIPFRFFAAAAAYHAAFWAWLLFAADEVPPFVQGGGRVLGAVHFLTLGVFAAIAFGAAFQLLPVATKRPLGSSWAPRLVSWLLLPSVPVFAVGVSEHIDAATVAGAAAAAAALLIGGAVLARNLARPGGMIAVVAHVGVALLALVALAAIGVLLAVDQRYGFLPGRGGFAVAHAALAIYGFMGLLALGFSYVLLPMFALAPAPPVRPALVSLAFAGAGLALAASGAFAASSALVAAGIVLGLAGSAIHFALLQRALAKRMRRQMGPFLILVRCAWICLPASLLLAGALALGIAPENGVALFGAVALVGWLLSFVVAIFQRIVPFLAAMHASSAKRGPPLVSTLTPERTLAVHRYAHLAALVLLLAGIAAGQVRLVQAAAAIGLAGALALAWFVFQVLQRLAEARAA